MGAVCATCAVAVPTSNAAAQSPGVPASVKTVTAKAPGDLRTGAKRVLISAPGTDVDLTVVLRGAAVEFALLAALMQRLAALEVTDG